MEITGGSLIRMFVGRHDELRKLDGIFKSDGFSCLVIYGNPGAGKTTLIEEFCKDKDAIIFTVKSLSSRANLVKFSSKVLEHYNDTGHQPFSFWENPFSYIREKQAGSRIIIVLDEFSEIAERDAAFMKVLGGILDNELKDSNVFLILTSGNVKLIQKDFLNVITPISRKINEYIYLDKFLNDETAEKLKEETIRRSKGIDRTKFIRVSADEVILREGEKSSDMYKIISGTAICYLNYGTDKEYMLGSFKNEASFGVYQLLTGKPSLYTMAAFSDMLLLRIGRSEFRKFISMNTVNAIDIMRVQAKMLGILKFHLDMLIDEMND